MWRILALAVPLLALVALACDQEAEEETAVASPNESPAIAAVDSPTPSPEPTVSAAPEPRLLTSVALKAGAPSSVAVNPDTSRIYVAYSDIDILSVIDADTYEISATLDLPAGALHTVAVNPATNKVYVTNGGNGTISVIDGDTHDITKSLNVPTRSDLFRQSHIHVNPATNRIYVSRGIDYIDRGMTVIDGETDAVIGHVKLDGAAWKMSDDPSTNDLYTIIEYSAQNLTLCPEFPPRVLVLIDTSDNSLSECLDFGYYPLAVGVSPDGSRLYHWSNSWRTDLNESVTVLTVVEISTGRALTTIEYPAFTAKDVIVGPATGRVYVMADDSHDCCIIGRSGQLVALDGDNRSIAWSVPLDSGPIAFTADFDAGRFYVLTADRTLRVIEE